MRTSMATLTYIWMTLLLSNILPSNHNSDLPLLKCQLVYAILTQVSVHVAQLISDTIYQFVGIAPTRGGDKAQEDEDMADMLDFLL